MGGHQDYKIIRAAAEITQAQLIPKQRSSNGSASKCFAETDIDASSWKKEHFELSDDVCDEKMSVMRKGVGGHHDYKIIRAAAEITEAQLIPKECLSNGSASKCFAETDIDASSCKQDHF